MNRESIAYTHICDMNSGKFTQRVSPEELRDVLDRNSAPRDRPDWLSDGDEWVVAFPDKSKEAHSLCIAVYDCEFYVMRPPITIVPTQPFQDIADEINRRNPRLQ